jgi:uncharacterized membrane protein YfcA
MLSDPALGTLAVATAGVFLAAILRGFTGFGFGLAAVPLLSLVLPPAQAVPFVVVLQVVVGVIGLRENLPHCDWRSVGALYPGLLLGAPIGITILSLVPANPTRLVIGLIIAASVALLYRGARLPPKPSRLVGFAVGLVSGVISGLSMMGGPPIVVYLLALGHGALVARATSMTFFMLSGLTAAVPMALTGLIDLEILLWSAVSFPIVFLGTWIGTKGFHRARAHHHRAVALIVLSALSVALIGRALLG